MVEVHQIAKVSLRLARLHSAARTKLSGSLGRRFYFGPDVMLADPNGPEDVVAPEPVGSERVR